ncbi:MAG: uracil phosphoribosyltransferase [Pseudomonadota bacterium]|jgi:uracil phosphoribosyltransferase
MLPPSSLHLIPHPLIQHKLSLLRQRDRSTSSFRRLMHEMAMLMAYELTRDMPMRDIEIETPLARMRTPVIEGKKVVLVPILRAGQGLLDGMLDVIPGARVGHVGLYRDPMTHEAIEYYCKLPHDLGDRDVIVLDPMLATGHSAIAAVDRVAEAGPRSIRFACLVASPEGLQAFHDVHPDVTVFAVAVDQGLDEQGYIVPGLGDAGDRLYGTR